MAHPYHHSVSSANNPKFQGNNKWEDHFELHAWLDSSKFAFADARHRSLFHNPAGVSIASKLFKDIKNAKEIATQHITEDMGKVYQIKDWLPLEYWPSHTLNNEPLNLSELITLKEAKTDLMSNNPFPLEIQPQIALGLDLLLSPEKTESFLENDPRRFFMFSSVGPYIIEKLLGPTLNPNGYKLKPTPQNPNNRLLATRSVFEFFIQKIWGLIPSPQDFVSQRPIEDWMWRKARPLSKEI